MNSVSPAALTPKSGARTTIAQPPAADYMLNWLDGALALLLCAASLALYVRTLAPFVLGSDSGEFQVLAYQLGIAHTPGYPVYLALLLCAASLALYVRTLAPFVLGSDSGEFQVLAYQLGIAHTPGYPVYLA